MVSFNVVDNIYCWTPLSPFRKFEDHKGNIVLNIDIVEIYE